MPVRAPGGESVTGIAPDLYASSMKIEVRYTHGWSRRRESFEVDLLDEAPVHPHFIWSSKVPMAAFNSAVRSLGKHIEVRPVG